MTTLKGEWQGRYITVAQAMFLLNSSLPSSTIPYRLITFFY